MKFKPPLIICNVCAHRATLRSRRVILSPRVPPRGWWTPKNPNALSALSTRPPYSERTPLPPGLASPFFPLSLLLCAFSLWLSPLEPPPLLFSPAITCVFIWNQHDLQQLPSSLSLAPCPPLSHTLLQPADFINPLLAASPHSSSLLLTSYPPCVLFFSLLSRYRW